MNDGEKGTRMERWRDSAETFLVRDSEDSSLRARERERKQSCKVELR